MSLFYVANPLEAKIRRAPVRGPFSCHGRCLFSGHARFDVRQGAVDTGEDPLLAHQRHHGVGDARGLTRIGALNYSAAMRASIYAKARSIRARTRSLPTSAITASMAGDWPRPVTAMCGGKLTRRPCALRYTPGRGRCGRGPYPCPPAPSRHRWQETGPDR